MMRTNPDFERYVFPVEFQFAEPNSEHGGIVEGYGSVFGSIHESNQTVDPGAFKKTIAERIKRSGGSMVPYLDSHEWNIAHTIGTVVDGSEDSKGFHFRAQLSKAPSAQEARLKMIEGHIKRNSIGFNAVRETYQTDDLPGDRMGVTTKVKRRHIQELKLFELSALPLADDPEAVNVRVHGMVPFQDLPLAPRDTKWEWRAARDRVIAWAKRGDDIDWAKLRRAFLLFEPEHPDDVDTYKFQIGDVIDGELMAVPAAIEIAANEYFVDAAERVPVERYYEKMAAEFGDESLMPPWKKASIDTLLLETKRIGVYDMGDIRKAADEIFSVLKPEDRTRLLAELSAGPAAKPPTEGTRDSGALDDAKRTKLASRLTQLGSTVSDLTRRRGQ